MHAGMRTKKCNMETVQIVEKYKHILVQPTDTVGLSLDKVPDKEV